VLSTFTGHRFLVKKHSSFFFTPLVTPSCNSEPWLLHRTCSMSYGSAQSWIVTQWMWKVCAVMKSLSSTTLTDPVAQNVGKPIQFADCTSNQVLYLRLRLCYSDNLLIESETFRQLLSLSFRSLSTRQLFANPNRSPLRLDQNT
jgi:hypothetical protein